MDQSIEIANTIFNASKPVLRIHGLVENFWKRNTANGPQGKKDKRIGPWMQGEYEVLDQPLWVEPGPCLYMVKAGEKITYVGISKNGLKDRWRLSPAYDAQTMVRLPKNQIFHSQCWRHIQNAVLENPGTNFEVRAIKGQTLGQVLREIGEPLSAFAAFGDDGESIVASVERWLCNRKSENLATWNISMTGKKARSRQAA